MLDEPTSALDPIGRKETINIINSLKGKYTVVFSTHILTDVERVCDRIALIEKGTLVLEGSMNDIKSKYMDKNGALNIDIAGNNKSGHDKFLSEIKNLDFVDKTDYTEYQENGVTKISLKTSDRNKIGEIIPKMINENGLSLVKFEFEELNLEDIFISATSSESDKEKKEELK